MQFTVASETLVSALGWVAKALPNRPATPVLAGLKMSVDNGTLTLAAFDYEQSSLATVAVENASDGTALVSGRLLADIVRALPKADVTFTLDGPKLLVKAKASRFTLQVMPLDDYPVLPSNPPALGTVDPSEFSEAVRSVAPAAGRDDMLPVLTAISMHFDPSAHTITLAATDRYRLAVRTLNYTPTADAREYTALVPARTLDTWAKTLSTGTEEFQFGAGEGDTKVFSISATDRSATVRLLDGQYPKYRALLPATFNTEVTFETSDLIDAAKRVSLVAQPGTPIGLAFGDGGLTVSASADDQATEDVAAEHHGEKVTIGFNNAYLLDGLNALGNQTATFHLVSATKPAVLRPSDGSENYTYLLMPMRGGVS